ncbi:MAG TPA: hypothetical protein VF530_12695 [Planctomycetota bacterium]
MNALLVLSLVLLRLGDGEAVPASDLEFASLAVTDGIVGGLIASQPRVVLAVGFDRVERVFRAVRRRGGPEGEEVWAADLEPERFRALLDLAVATGLPGLPLENPPSCMDVYDRGRQVRLDYGNVRWVNGAPGGCVQSPSTVVPGEKERRHFDDVVEKLEQAIDALPLRRSVEAQLERVPFFADIRALDTYHRVIEHVLAGPLHHSLDLERVWAGERRVSFVWRGRRSGEASGDVDFVIDRAGRVVRAPSPSDRFDPFVPVTTGMTLAEVVARLGEPDERKECGAGLVVTYSPRPSRLGHRPVPPARLRFESGRLCPP